MTDDDLRERLRRADPAARLEPASPAQVEHLVEEAMSRSPVRRWAAPVAAALVLLAGGTAWAALRPDPKPLVSPAIIVATPVPSVQVPAGGQAKCAEPKPELLDERAFFAFAGTVTEINDGSVTMKITHNYRNLEGPGVTIPQPEGGSETMPGSGRFELGKDYLVAATGNGDMLICGYSGEADTPGLRELYEAAF
ncbi:hypothetical protein Aca07nite_63640 [Actinoplanes capillaceus]|uniref:DUF4367 domain-containing protein n=1 Tax=Actinoplanes campanulatus TaxID=113559 RepID=A0ABQ3WS63_9ACTN|nr:hypothetical protein [Actinoplanes capillaceus]GID49089.1 hypothetical protein Aca07nite_63640 [Actinoplanes capillaceus]